MEKDTKNRIIKFRGKQIYDGKWVYGNLIIYSETDYEIEWFWEIDKRWYRSKVVPETVGLFTGVKHNDREIYEHDLVECVGILCEIVYNDKIGAFVLLEVLTQNLGNKPIGQMTDMFGIRSVGNIFDNKELLKGEQQ